MKLARLKAVAFDIRIGSCSGFPTCCIAWFSFVWSWFDWNEGLQGWRIKYFNAAMRRGFIPGYVPCPLCLISGAKVKTNICTDECGHLDEAPHIYRSIRTDE